jgi:hypothetical protein
MFCAECGNAIRADLNYCNRCGGEVSRTDRGDRSVVQNLTNVLGAIGVFGLLGFVAILWTMLRNSFETAGIVWISLFYLTTLFGLCALILRQTAAFTLGRKSRGRNDDEGSGAPAYLTRARTAQLNEPTDRPASVTEHTTRTLDKVPAAGK